VVEEDMDVDDDVDENTYDFISSTFTDDGANSMKTPEGITIAIVKGSIAAQQVGWSIGCDVARRSCNCKQSPEHAT
jgi:hypothetical protein